MLEKTFNPAEVEATFYPLWEQSGAFRCRPDSAAEPFSIVIPPPNVTGSLHMGHALNNTIQDILSRYWRMKGRDVLWQPGTDHAGIATQMVVERQLAQEQKNRRDIGREKFIERIWAWKAELGGTITRQLRRLGASCDWSRERFTMDEGLSTAVRKVFVALYKKGLIYRDKRLVNWDPRFHTAISDLEVEQHEVKGQLWHFRYPIEGEEGRYIVVATTRPETMLGDTGVAVHPDDERYKDLAGRHAILPLVGRRIPIVADAYADPETGSGAVKITPAHDFNDFDVGRRHDLPLVNIFDIDAKLNENAPEKYRGLDRFEARKRVVADMEAAGLVEKIEPHTHMVPHGDRSAVPDRALPHRPMVRRREEARRGADPRGRGRQDRVRSEAVGEDLSSSGCDNIQPWTISRQIWWGHQIPAWYGPDGTIFVEETEAEARAAAENHYGRKVELRRDEDVLDTWFSSALWPFSTLGWPEETKELKRYYPTSVLVTGFDIIFFWVARMMMMGCEFMGEVPFRTVYIHALVRDERGQKMSKSKGNVIDPLELIDKFGADALRFTLAALAAQGRDVKMSESRVEGYRNFATKLWNAVRFAEMSGCALDPAFDPAGAKLGVNRWIVGSVAEAGRRTAEAIEAYKFNEAAGALYQFVWGTFCDWYIEFTKPIINGTDEAAKAETRATTAWVLSEIVHLLHPIMPFITEAVWRHLAGEKADLLITSRWPEHGGALGDAAASAEMEWVVRLVSTVRAVRAEMNVPAAAQVPLLLKDASSESLARLERHRDLIVRLARLSRVGSLAGEPPKGAVQAVLDEATLVLPIGDVVDLAQERQRLQKEIAKLEGEIDKIAKKLGNEQFLAKAKPEVVEEQRERQSEAEQARAKLKEALGRLAAA